MKVFISHIHEESQLAIVLKNWIESTFLGRVEVFASSSNEDIPAGSEWLEQIRYSLNKCALFIVLCSKNSLDRSWINFESGCAWLKEIPIIPICHSGIKKNSLKVPLALFQALDIEQSTFCEDLFNVFIKELKLHILPRLSYDEMKSEIKSALSSIEDLKKLQVLDHKPQKEKSNINIFHSKTLVISNSKDSYNCISEAMKENKTREEIFIKKGIYLDNHIYLEGKKQYVINGEGCENTIIYSSFSINCISCEISGITVISRDRSSPCINIMGGKNSIYKCRFSRGRDGIMIQRFTKLKYDASENIIKDNIFSDNYMGIWVGLKGRAIIENNFFDNNLIGIVAAENLIQTLDEIASINSFKNNIRADYAGSWDYLDGTMNNFYRWVENEKIFKSIELTDDLKKIKY